MFLCLRLDKFVMQCYACFHILLLVINGQLVKPIKTKHNGNCHLTQPNQVKTNANVSGHYYRCLIYLNM